MFMRFIHDLQQDTFICNVAQSIETTSTREMAMQWWERLRLWTWWWGRLCCCLGEVVFGCFLILDYVCAERCGGVDLFSHPSDFETSDFAYEGAGGNRFHINRGKRGGGKSVFTSLRFWNAYETLRSHKIGEVHELVSKRFEFFSAIFKHCFHMVSFLSGTFLRHFFLRKQFLRWGVSCFSSIQYC